MYSVIQSMTLDGLSRTDSVLARSNAAVLWSDLFEIICKLKTGMSLLIPSIKSLTEHTFLPL